MAEMTITRTLILIITILSFIGCKDRNHSPIVFNQADSPHHIDKHIETAVGQSITIDAGAELIIGDGINIVCFGDVFINGTAVEPVLIKAKNQDPGWGYLKLKNEAKQFKIQHTTIQDGIVTSYNSNNHFSNVHFINRQNLNWEWAAARFWFGKVLIENCKVTGVNKAEGFLLHDVNDAVVKNCQFQTVPDGVEYINCDRGEIINNIFKDGIDDAIDLNGCKGTLIKDNQISGYADAGMELGSENFGRSTDLIVESNVIKDCGIGVILKQSSEATFNTNVLSGNKVGFDISTSKDSIITTQAIINECIITGSEENIKSDDRSEVMQNN